jgi:hypothetical protein
LRGELEKLASSYARLSHDVGGRINFACDLNSDVALDLAEQEKAHLDQAFFVLGFAALERQVTLLASARLADAGRREAMREASFEKRWQASIQVANEILGIEIPWRTAERVIFSWYSIRNLIAHGQSPTQLADVPSVLYRADDVAATLAEVARVLGDRRPEN